MPYTELTIRKNIESTDPTDSVSKWSYRKINHRLHSAPNGTSFEWLTVWSATRSWPADNKAKNFCLQYKCHGPEKFTEPLLPTLTATSWSANKFTVTGGGTRRFRQLSNAATSNELTPVDGNSTFPCYCALNTTGMVAKLTNYGKCGERKVQGGKENKENATECTEYIKCIHSP